MASRAHSDRWLWRDKSKVFPVLVWIAFVASVMVFFIDGSVIEPRAPQVTELKQSNDDELYTGSIIFVAPTGDRCWQRMLDNRDGKLWDRGYVSCEDAIGQLSARRQGGMTGRIREISKVFRHDGG